MFLIIYLAIFTPTFASAESVRQMQMAPAHANFHFNQEQGKESGCVVSMEKPEVVNVLSETPDSFEIEWSVVPRGCLWQQIRGQKLNRGFVRKRDVIWQDDLKTPLPLFNFKDRFPEFADRPVDCLDAATQKFIPPVAKNLSVTELIDYLRREVGGVKSVEKIDLWQRCYPDGKNGLANYNKYKKFFDLSGDVFRVTNRKEPQEVNPSLLGCLFRRESGLNPNIQEPTGAAGLGQHTNVNIKELSTRMKKPGSWEKALWNNFFEKAKADPDGRAMLAACKGSSKNGEPVFDTKEDALCPLQSMAAGSIYILMIQRELSRNSKIYAVDWENELEYQLAIAAAYNLGDGASGQAVKDLLVKDWVGAIRKKSSQGKYGKDCEVMLHINAVRNCMQESDPWQPMYPTEKPQCSELKGVKIDVKQKLNTCDTGLNGSKADKKAEAKPSKKAPEAVKPKAAANSKTPAKK